MVAPGVRAVTHRPYCGRDHSRAGRIRRYKGHTIRTNVAATQLDVHRDHRAYVARHPGPRPSPYRANRLSPIVAWRERWDLLGLGERP